MAVNLHIPPDDAVFPVDGIEIGVTEAGIRKADRRDLTVVRSAPLPSRCANSTSQAASRSARW